MVTNKKKITKFLYSPISLISSKYILIFLLLYLILITISSILYGYLLNLNNKLYDENLNIIFKNISFSNGDLIFNLFYNNEYYTEFKNIKFYLQKTPAIPFLIYYISLISKNFYFIIILKNIIFYIFYFFICYVTLKSIKRNFLTLIILLIIPIIIPYNFGVSLNFVYEDSLVAILLPCLFLLVITDYKYKNFIIGLLCFILYFVKTSMFFVITLIPILVIIFEKKSLNKYIPIIFSCIAILIWGFYGLNKTGKFSVLSTGSSINTFAMSFAYNENFHKYYPNKSTDLIPIDHDVPKKIKNEWEFFEFYKKKNNEYLNRNLNRYIKDTFIKLKFILFGVKRDGALPNQYGNYDNKIRISQLFSKILLNLSIIIIFFKCFTNFKKFIVDKKNIFFCSIIIFNLLPHLMVWATSKHLIGIINVSFIFIFFNLEKLKKFYFLRS